MAIQAIDRKLAQFLDPNEQIIYVIPTYQREYSWRVDNCQALINDIIENDSNYFIGSIIWINDTKEIIDGQQRLTSISLLMVALYDRLDKYNLANNEDLLFKKNSLKRMIVFGNNNRIVPQRQGNNKDDFEYLIKSIILKQPCAKPTNFGNRRVAKNFYDGFCETIKNFDINQLEELYDKICSLTFVSAKVDDPQTAFTLFETMNNRGLPLSAIDLIKSSYMSQTNDTDSITNWENLVSILGNEYNQEQFLRNNYNAFRKEYNNINVVTNETKYEIAAKATRSNVIKIYSGHLVARDDFMDFITVNAKFNSLLTGETEPQIEISEGLKEIFKNVRNANATSSFILLLFLLRNQIPYNFTDENLIDLFELNLRFFIRRNLTNNPSTGAIPQILMDIISQINSLNNVTFESVRQILLTKFIEKTSSDDMVKEVLSGDIYDTNRDMARYLLCSLCRNTENNEKRFIDLWEKSDEKYIWTIEHILPEGNKEATNIPIDWMNMIREGDNNYHNYSDQQIIELIKNYRHKIGNLTLTGYNSSLSNRNFSEKKDRTNQNGEPVGYNNGLSLNEYVYNQTNWHISNIKERTTELVNEIINNLKIE